MIRSTCFVANTVASTIGGRGSRRGRHHRSSCRMVHLERIVARIFCPFPDPTTAVTMSDSAYTRGGNPVNIFKVQPTTADAPVTTLSPELCSQLASSCVWESVFVFPPDISANAANDAANDDDHSTLPQLNMAFYLPTGQPVSFCAHAAMGAAYAYFQDVNSVAPKVQLNVLNNDGNDGAASKGATLAVAADHDVPSPIYVATFQQEENDTRTDSNHYRSGTIALEVQNIVWQQEPIEHPTTLHRILREYHKVNGSTDCTLPMIEVMPTQEQWQEQNLDQYEPQILKSKYNKVIPLPTFLNSWVGDRKKTLVYINKDDTLHQRILPPPDRAAAVQYPAACDSLQHTTGLYLYATKTTPQDKMADAREIKLDYPVLDPNAEENVWECVRMILITIQTFDNEFSPLPNLAIACSTQHSILVVSVNFHGNRDIPKIPPPVWPLPPWRLVYDFAKSRPNGFWVPMIQRRRRRRLTFYPPHHRPNMNSIKGLPCNNRPI